MRHAVQDADERKLLRRAAPLAAKLQSGKNYFEPKDFLDLVYFYLDGLAKDEAIACGTFNVQRRVEIVRAQVGNLMTLSELSRKTGVSQSNLWRWVSKANLPFKSIGNKKLYNLNEIEQLLFNKSDAK